MYIYLYALFVAVVLINSIVSLPVLNDTKQQQIAEPVAVDQSIHELKNNTTVIETSSSKTTNDLSTSTDIGIKLNTDVTSGSSIKQTSNDAAVGSSSRGTTGRHTTRRYTTGRYTTGYYPSGGGSGNDLSGGSIFLIIVGIIIFCCCCCGGGTYYKTGHWETARVWVND